MSLFKTGGIAFALTFLFLFSIAADLEDDSKISPLVRCFAGPEKPAPPFADGKFDPKKGETISFIGGTNTFDQQKYPYLEMLLQLAYPELKLKIRNLAWQGDTVFEQVRPRFYFTRKGDSQPGSVPDQRDRIEPGIVFVNFGKMESLDPAPDALEKFIAAYEKFLDQLQTRTNRIVLVGITPFTYGGTAGRMAKARNKNRERYNVEIDNLAAKRNLPMVKIEGLGLLDGSFAPDSIHLSRGGQWQVASFVSSSLKFPGNATSASDSEDAALLVQAIQRKNFLFQQYYHPTNWAFLYGDRQHVPASRDHLDNENRWFIKEVKLLPGLVKETEADIHRYASEISAKLSK